MGELKKYQIFISSTLRDLTEERRLVTEQVLNLGHFPVGMESFQAGNVSQWEYIKRRIRECDYYVVIIADMYGSADETGMSYTEKEYRYALSLGVPVAAFVMSSEARQQLPRARIETNKRKEKRLEEFRQLALSKISVLWSNHAQLAGGVSTSLSELFQLQPRAGLTRKVIDASPQSARSAPSEKDVSWLRQKISEEFHGLTIEATHIQLLGNDPDHDGNVRVTNAVSLTEALGPGTRYKLLEFEIFDVMRRSYIGHTPPSFWEVFQDDFEKKMGDRYRIFRQSVEARHVMLDFSAHFAPYQLVKELATRGILIVEPDKDYYDWDNFYVAWSEKGKSMIAAWEAMNPQ